MRLRHALLSTVFFFAAPGSVSGLVPYLLTRWQPHDWNAAAMPARVLGWLLLGVGLVVLTDSFRRFVTEGRGTPAPVEPPTDLVVRGFYRHVRNPMYVANLALIIGQALILNRFVLLGYAAGLWLVFTAFVMFYEEPTLARQFGSSYDSYRTAVPRWLPRMRAWHGDRPAH